MICVANCALAYLQHNTLVTATMYAISLLYNPAKQLFGAIVSKSGVKRKKTNYVIFSELERRCGWNGSSIFV